MSLTIADLQPKKFTVIVKGVELQCNPLRLSHALTIAKIGDILKNPENATTSSIQQAEADMDNVIADLIPELAGTKLDMSNLMELMSQMMDTIQPDDNKELEEKGVKLDSDPKAQTIG